MPDGGVERTDGELWVDTGTGVVHVWSEALGDWVAAVDPGGKGGFFGDGRTGLEGETAEERWKRVAEKALGDTDRVRLGDHWAVRVGGIGEEVWTCEVCGGESGDAGILAETECCQPSSNARS